jgi:hypothetical protein
MGTPRVPAGAGALTGPAGRPGAHIPPPKPPRPLPIRMPRDSRLGHAPIAVSGRRPAQPPPPAVDRACKKISGGATAQGVGTGRRPQDPDPRCPARLPDGHPNSDASAIITTAPTLGALKSQMAVDNEPVSSDNNSAVAA